MKKIFSFAIILGLAGSLFAFENVKVSLTPGFGLMTGQVEEYVFEQYIKGCEGDYLLSRLDWDVKPVSFFSLKGDLTIIDHIYIGAEGKAGLPGICGKMIDNDWMNTEVYTDPITRYQTNYSEHNNYLNRMLNGKVTLGGIITLPASTYIMPCASFMAQEFFFTGKNGFLQYGAKIRNGYYYRYDDENESHLEKYDFEDRNRVITYDQCQYMFLLGVKAGSEVIPHIRFDFLVEYSPNVWVLANDVHYKTDDTVGIDKTGTYYRDFIDMPKGFGVWNLEGEISFKFNENNMLGFKATYYYMPILKGKDSMKNIRTKKYDIQNGFLGGASSSLFSAQLIYTLSL